MRRSLFGSALIVLALVAGISAQQTQTQQAKPSPQPSPTATPASTKPNFSGTWIQQSPAQGSGDETIVKHTDKTLTLMHDESEAHKTVFSADGTEYQSTMQSHNMNILTTSKASWKDDRLTITSVTDYTNGRRLDQTMVWYFDDKGLLIVDVTSQVTGMPVESMQIVYRKK